MPRPILIFVRFVDRLNYGVGRFAMYLLYVLMAILLWSSMSKIIQAPAIWTLEIAQFMMVAYYILGGPYSMQLGSHVRMDLVYDALSYRRRLLWDAFTIFVLIFYLCVMLYGAVQSTAYSFGLKYYAVEISWLPFDIPWGKTGFMERNPSAWRPYLWPIKLVMVLGFFLMILQSLSFFFRDIAALRGVKI